MDMNKIELRAAAARLLYNDNRDSADYEMLIRYIDNSEPVKWVSVDDRLPEAAYDCFVWYSCDTAYGKCKSWGIAHCSRGDWYTKHLDGDNIVVLCWMPLPEPPKGE